MKTSSRLLIGFGAAIAVLVIVAVVLVLTLGQASSPALPGNTPQGTVQRYLQAVQNKDYTTAYNMLDPAATTNPKFPDGPQQTFDDYVMSAQGASNNTWKATLGTLSDNGTNASVEIEIEVFSPQGPFGNSTYSHNITFVLKKSGDKWIITAPSDLFWLY
jgi:hypothetical protein